MHDEKESKNDEKKANNSGSNGTELNLWKKIAALSGLMAVIAIGYIIKTMPTVGASEVSEEEILQKIETLVTGGETEKMGFSISDISVEHGLYVILFTLDTENGPVEQQISISKDGELLVMQTAIYDDILQQIQTMKAQETVQPEIKTEDNVSDEPAEDMNKNIDSK